MEYSIDDIEGPLEGRIIRLDSTVDERLASEVCDRLLFLESQDSEREICLYIDSPGGALTAVMAIYDTMRYITVPVITVCTGRAVSMAAFLLAAGEPGMRFALPDSHIVLQPLTVGEWRHSDEKLHMEALNRIFAENTGLPYEDMVDAAAGESGLSAADARDLGIIDQILLSS
ncbi:MAG: ATP-dependent Clp protease proteolytic subunit [Desulfovibrionaceae bacterium]|nr:ATP-dependent Clp protease proteolytic subunit [Desulfovibrionaceae bacterium]